MQSQIRLAVTSLLRCCLLALPLALGASTPAHANLVHGEQADYAEPGGPAKPGTRARPGRRGARPQPGSARPGGRARPGDRGQRARPTEPTAAPKPSAPRYEAPTSTRPRSTSCDVIHSLTGIDRDQRQLLHDACTGTPRTDAATYAALFRLVSSSGWHVGVVATILAGKTDPAITVWSDGKTHDPPAVGVAQEHIDADLPAFADGLRCSELRRSDELADFLDALDADEEPESLPFTSELTDCLGVPRGAMEGARLLTIRADGLEDVTVIMGTRDFVHARRFHRKQALRLGNHRFFIIAVPEASPVAVFANHENLELPVIWRGLMGRNALVWAKPPRRSCLDLSVDMNPSTHLYIDGVRVDGGGSDPVCAGKSDTDAPRQTVDRTLAITLDRPDTGLPDHEVAALTCEGKGKDRRPVVRHLSPLNATAPSEQLRQTGECESLRLDLSTPEKQRVAVLGVSKLQGCEATPLWASDIQERARHILGQDAAHRGKRTYANFSAYAEATEALSSLETQMGGDAQGGPDRGADTNTLLGSAAQEAWRQGIDTLLSFALQCTPRGKDDQGELQWAYSIRATSIQVSDLFARGYYGREGIDLEDFIDVESVGFMTADQQDASLGALLDRVFAVDTPRFTPPPVDVYYRRSQTLRISRYFNEPVAKKQVPEEFAIRYRAFHKVGRPPNKTERKALREEVRVSGPEYSARPRLCERLVHRGARPPGAIAAAREKYATLGTEEHLLVLQRSREELDMSSNPQAAVHKGELKPPRPGWYLIAIEDEQGEIQDAVCINATTPGIEVWGQATVGGGPLAFAGNGSRARLHVRPRLGSTWYLRGRWLGLGFGLGYGLTRYQGDRADWTDLAIASPGLLDWSRHALLVAPHVEARTRSTALPFELRARLHPTLDAALVDIRKIDRALVSFRDSRLPNTVLDFDFDLDLDLILGVPVGPIQVEGIVTASYMAVDDDFYRSGASVTQDANFMLGFGLGISGGRP